MGAWRQFTIADGFSNNTIYAVYEDENGYFWMPSDYGIIQFHKTTHFTKAYLKKDGITYNEFNRTSHLRDEVGNLYFGGINGITAFHPKDFSGKVDTLDVPLRITEFRQYDAELDKLTDKTREILNKPQIVLRPGERFFNLKFALLEYHNPEQTRYAYQIAGQDKEWNYISDNSLRVSGLGYGNYLLKVKGQGSNGQFSKQELSIPIQVLKPFYWQNWFLITALLSGLILVFVLYKYRTGKLKRQRAILEKKVKERTKVIKKQKEELEKLDVVKSRFFANVSHELRTPLTLLLAPIQSVLKKNKLDNADFTKLMLAKKYGVKLHKMIDEILDLTKLESGKITLRPTTVVWYNYLRKTVADFESYANQKNIQFTFHYEGNQHLQVELDKKKIEIILMNLLSNAFKFTPKNGKIALQARNQGQYLVIAVTDTGCGIHPDDLPNIFDRFYQTNQKNIPAEGGTGIGLALTREFVQLMEGEISVKSDLGQGATFQVKIPCHEVISQLSTEDTILIKNENPFQQVPLIMTDSTSKDSPLSQRKTILVVEDNYDLRKFIKILLGNKYQVLEAENGAEALERVLSASPPDLILSDIMMPVMDGYQLLNTLKSDLKTASIPVIMLTARGGKDDKLKALRIGVDDYMNKPFDEEELLVRIENLLKNAGVRQSAKAVLGKRGAKSSNNKTEVLTNLDKYSEEWLNELEILLEKNIAQFNYNSDQLAEELNLSKRQLERRLKSLIGLTPAQYFKTLRLNKARTLLSTEKNPAIKSVALSVGYKDIAYFSRLFKEEFGKNPSDYAREYV